MVHSMYWISTVGYAFALLILLQQDVKFKISNDRMDRAYRFLVLWVVFFCLQDAVWGIAASTRSNRDALFVVSMLFHIFTAMTALVWLNFVLSYLGKSVKSRNVLLGIESFVVFCQVVLLVANIFVPLVYSVSEDGAYITEPVRPLSFTFQYVGYVVVAIAALISMQRNKQNRVRYRAVLLFIGAPLLFGVLLLFYPELPLNSMGYFFGCVIIHSFIVSGDREELRNKQFKQEMEYQIMVSNTDEMTGLLNRRAYEVELNRYEKHPMEEDLVYIAMDINGLKTINDTKGHAAGDEMIIGSARIIQQAFGEYGKIFRTGGDEFVAILHMDKAQTKVAIANLRAQESMWKGNLSKSLSVSLGCVAEAEYPEKSILEIAILADKRMYKDKRAYYTSQGIDRRGSR